MFYLLPCECGEADSSSGVASGAKEEEEETPDEVLAQNLQEAFYWSAQVATAPADDGADGGDAYGGDADGDPYQQDTDGGDAIGERTQEVIEDTYQ